MTVRFAAIGGHAGRRRPTRAAVALAALLYVANVPAQTAGASAAVVASSPVAGLESLVSRIALYPDDGRDFTELCRRADAAMYRAKGAGRNMTQLCDGSAPADGPGAMV